jgi:hypothetical protein
MAIASETPCLPAAMHTHINDNDPNTIGNHRPQLFFSLLMVS